MEYVVGFSFTQNKQHVLLIQKNRPDWQAGRLNGIGGKIEKGETEREAIVREFEEETGLSTTQNEWEPFLYLNVGTEDIVYFFKRFSDQSQYFESVTDENIYLLPVEYLNNFRLVNNLKWVVPLCLVDMKYPIHACEA